MTHCYNKTRKHKGYTDSLTAWLPTLSFWKGRNVLNWLQNPFYPAWPEVSWRMLTLLSFSPAWMCEGRPGTKDICWWTKDILEVTKVSSALQCTCNSQSRSSCMSLQSKPRARPSTWRGTPQCELPSTSESLGLSLWQPCAEMRVNGTGTALPPRRFIVHSDSDAILVDGCDGALMNNFFWPTSRKVLPTFQTFCPGGPGSILPRW